MTETMVTVQALSLSEPDCSPEKRLLLAVLLNAIGHLQRGPGHAVGREAAEWIRGELRGQQAAFSFDGICEALDLDAGRLSGALLRPFETAGASSVVVPRRQVRLERVQSVPRRYRARDRAIAVD
ncbi:MAG: hypothetical protein ABIR79_08760 [Candidatus Binatia bacterium]